MEDKMFRGQTWIIICSFIILAIVFAGVFHAVTPVAAFTPQINAITVSGSLATNLHDQGNGLQTTPAQMNFQPSTDGCLLCYSPSHNLLSHLSGWLGK